MKPKEIVERIMTQHWDMVACDCWICEEGYKSKCGAKEEYLPYKETPHRPFVSVEGSWTDGVSRPVLSKGEKS